MQNGGNNFRGFDLISIHLKKFSETDLFLENSCMFGINYIYIYIIDLLMKYIESK
jgi:hypothetical protein